jgi:hypothetical protein
MSDDALNQGIELINSGNIPMGLKVLAEVVKEDPQNDMAWVWLSACYSEKERKIYCLNRAVKINPKNPLAIQGLTHLGEPLPVIDAFKEDAKPIEQPKNLGVPEEEVPPFKGDEHASVLSKFEAAINSTENLEPPEWSAKPRRPRPARKTRGKSKPLFVVLLVILILILIGMAYVFFPRIKTQFFPEASHFNENTQAFIQEVELLMAISDGSNNLGAFKTQQGLVYKAYDRLQPEWPPEMIYQKNEIDVAFKGWSAVGAIADTIKGSDECKVEGPLLVEVKAYTNSLVIDHTCGEWAESVMDIANRHFNQARPGLESYYAR